MLIVKSRILSSALWVLGAFTLTVSAAQADTAQSFSSQRHDFKVAELAGGLNHPWGMAFLPNGDILVTERAGRLRVLADGQLVDAPIAGGPEVDARGQGGLLDVALDPDFATNQTLYLSYSGSGAGGVNTEVARARLQDMQLTDLQVIFAADPKTRGKAHYGSRLAFDKDNKLIITLGDRYSFLHDAQDPKNHIGVIARINTDGSVPPDNPFANGADGEPRVYSYGHRNVQGLAVRPEDQSIWAHEHGPRGGDEVNKLIPGANFGWPAITYGIDYSGAIISEKTEAPGMEQPIVYWVPSIAPSGMAFYTGDKFPEWQGNLFVGSLKFTHLRRLTLDGDEVVDQEPLIEDLRHRIRDVRNGPDGYLYVLTDSPDGKVLRLEPES